MTKVMLLYKHLSENRKSEYSEIILILETKNIFILLGEIIFQVVF